MLPEDQEKINLIRNWVIAFHWEDGAYGVGVRVTVQYPIVCKHYNYRSFEEALDIILKRIKYRAKREVRCIEMDREGTT